MNPSEETKGLGLLLNTALSQKPMSASSKIELPFRGKKSILKPSGSISKPKSKVSWGKLSVKIQLPSPDEEYSKGQEEGKSAREKFYTVGIDEREEYKQVHSSQNVLQKDPIIKRPPISLTQFLESNPSFQVQRLSPAKEGNTSLAKFLVPAPSSQSPLLLIPNSLENAGKLPDMAVDKAEGKTVLEVLEKVPTPEFKNESKDVLRADPDKTPPEPVLPLKVHFEDESVCSQQTSSAPSNNSKLTHSILKNKSNPLEEVEKQKMKATATKDDEILMTPVAKASRFRFVKSPADIFKTSFALKLDAIPQEDSEISTTTLSVEAHLKDALAEQNKSIRRYFDDRIKYLKNIMELMKQVGNRLASKRAKLDTQINNNMENQVISCAEVELAKLKSLVCQNTLYMDTVNYYTFCLKRFGWHIPAKTPFIHFPYVDFILSPNSTLCRLQLSKKEIINPDLSNVAAIISRDNSIRKIHLETNHRWGSLFPSIPITTTQAYLKAAMASICSEVETGLGLMNCMRSSKLGYILYEITSKVKQLKAYLTALSKISDAFTLSDLSINAEKGWAEYTVTVTTDKQKLLTCYKVSSPILELNRIVELVPLYVKELTENGERMKALRTIDRIRQEYEDAVKENLGCIRNPKMEIHNKFPEFVQKFLSHYEGLVICCPNNES